MKFMAYFNIIQKLVTKKINSERSTYVDFQEMLSFSSFFLRLLSSRSSAQHLTKESRSCTIVYNMFFGDKYGYCN